MSVIAAQRGANGASKQPGTGALNCLWAGAAIEELWRLGVGACFLAPGSRCTPLTVAVAHHPHLPSWVHFDERGVGYAALGYARATGRPAVVICTSGTAVANLLPAVVEASLDGVPLLLLTADRPPELRDCGANQSVDQVKCFAPYVRWQHDLPCPTTAFGLPVLLTCMDQAVQHATRAPAGPVHLNFMFREPFLPETEETAGNLPAGWLESAVPFQQDILPVAVPPTEALAAVGQRCATAQRGLIVAGALGGPDEAAAVARLAEQLGWPLAADVCSGLRLGPGPVGRVDYFDLLLLPGGAAVGLRPDVVLHIGGRVTSKRLLSLMAGAGADYVRIRPDPRRDDPLHLGGAKLVGDIKASCDALGQHVPAGRLAPHAQELLAAAAAAARRLDALLAADGLSEPWVARQLARLLPDDHGLVLAASLPIRTMDMFAAGEGGRARVAANRGASGIDGTIATAAGFARGTGRPTALLIGDLALLHDLNSLALVRDLPLTLIVLNNDGGGIFSFLPIAGQKDVFERYFATPHGLSFSAAAGLFGLAYAAPTSPAEFTAAAAKALAAKGPTLIEVRTDRRRNHALHARLQRALVAKD